MPQIFVFHYLREKKNENFFKGVFDNSKVKTVWGDYGEISGNKGKLEEAEKEIRNADSLFILLSRNVMEDPRAREWFYWASGWAQCRDVWILQPYEDIKRVLVPFYVFKHHVAYYPSPAWSEYLIQTVENRHNLRMVHPLQSGLRLEAPGSGPKDYFDEAAGTPLSDYSASKPTRFLTACPRYKTNYTLHMPEDVKITRCPDCHDFFSIQPSLKSFVAVKA